MPIAPFLTPSKAGLNGLRDSSDERGESPILTDEERIDALRESVEAMVLQLDFLWLTVMMRRESASSTYGES